MMITTCKCVQRIISITLPLQRNILREVKQSGEIHIVLDCDHHRIQGVMKQAQAVGMMSAYHSYLVTNLVGGDHCN